jgi:hypothetical protein
MWVGRQPVHRPARRLSLSLAGTTGSHEQKRHRRVCGGVGQHPGSVRDDDAGLGRGLDIDVVVAHAVVTDEPGTDFSFEQVRRQPVGHCRKHDIGLEERLPQSLDTERNVVAVQPHRRMATAQLVLDGLRPPAGHHDHGVGHVSVSDLWFLRSPGRRQRG